MSAGGVASEEAGAHTSPGRDPGIASPSMLPSDIDPTVFDEAFLRQLQRLTLLVKMPVRGGLKGARRSVRRGQSIEFADYRECALGDDLRQLDWNVYARLEKLFVKLFIEEEDLTVTLLLDASASMSSGRPDKLVFAKRAAAALGTIALAGEDRLVVASLQGRVGRRRRALRGSGRVLSLLRELSSIAPAEGRTDLVPALRHAAAQLHGRGLVVLISDLLDEQADRGLRDLAGTGAEIIVLHVLAPDELDPPFEGDLRLVDRETADRVDVSIDLTLLEVYRTRLAAWRAGLAESSAKRGITFVELSTDLPLAELIFAELRRRQVLAR